MSGFAALVTTEKVVHSHDSSSTTNRRAVQWSVIPMNSRVIKLATDVILCYTILRAFSCEKVLECKHSS